MHVVQAKMLKIPKPVLHSLNKNLIFWGFQVISDIFISQKNLLLKSPIYMMILSFKTNSNNLTADQKNVKVMYSRW